MTKFQKFLHALNGCKKHRFSHINEKGEFYYECVRCGGKTVTSEKITGWVLSGGRFGPDPRVIRYETVNYEPA